VPSILGPLSKLPTGFFVCVVYIFSYPLLLSSGVRKLRRFLEKGVIMDISKLSAVIRAHVGDLTFLEAYARTGRILNITVSSTRPCELPMLLNYLTSPDVLIWSAAAASCALPFLYESVELLAKVPPACLFLTLCVVCNHIVFVFFELLFCWEGLFFFFLF
jgi:hypothetical protein